MTTRFAKKDEVDVLSEKVDMFDDYLMKIEEKVDFILDMYTDLENRIKEEDAKRRVFERNINEYTIETDAALSKLNTIVDSLKRTKPNNNSKN